MHSPSRLVQAPIKSSLTQADGEKLMDLVVLESEKASSALEAQALPKVSLSKIYFEWVSNEKWVYSCFLLCWPLMMK